MRRYSIEVGRLRQLPLSTYAMWCSRQEKITALAIAFIVPTEICKQLYQALLLPRASDESQQGGIIAEHTMVHIAQQMVVW